MSLRKPSFRARKRWKTAFSVLGMLGCLALAVWGIWLVWLGRFVVYSRGDAALDFDWVTPGEFRRAEPPVYETVHILYDDGDENVVIKTRELQQLLGVYVTTDMLSESLTEVDTLLRQLPKGTAVMLEVKAGNGNFFYKTSIPGGKVSSKVNTEVMAELIRYLRKSDHYVVAAVPAFRDLAYGLMFTDQGIYHSSGRYLWAGADKCYWLDPTRSEVIAYLMSIGTELRDLGFNEVVFTDFAIPTGSDVRFDGDRTEVLNNAATQLVRNLAAEDFAISFQCDSPGFLLPQGRTRLYRTNVDGSEVQSAASGLTNPQIQLVCITEAKDTRFEAYGVLRPMALGQMLPEPTDPSIPSEPAGVEA